MRHLGDLVPMPLPTAYGPTVIPPQTASPGTAAPQFGWGAVPGGWTLGMMAGGVFTPLPGAPVVNSPGNPADIQAYFAGQVGGNPAQPSNQYPGSYAGGDLTNSQPVPIGSGVPLGPVSAASPVPPYGRRGLPTNWQRQPILPDHLLPPAIQRTNPLLKFATFFPNQWDRRLAQHANVWSYIALHGGLKKCCRLPELGAPIYDSPPWMVMPSQAEPFQEMFFQPVTAFQTGGAFNGLDVVLGQFVVQNGYDGAINRVVFNFNGTGFQDGSGSIIWRIKVGNRYVRNLGNVQNTFGDFQTAFMVPGQDSIRLISQQTVTLIANVPVGSPIAGPGYISGGCFGWFYPRR